jgi:hypothetical protein
MKGDKKLILMLLMLTVLTLSTIIVQAETNNYAPVKQGGEALIKQGCGTCTYMNVSIAYPNSSIAVSNAQMTNEGGGLWSYSFSDTNSLGRYDVITCGDINAVYQCTDSGTLWFDVTYSGSQLSVSNAIVYVILLISALIIFLLCLYGAMNIPWSNPRDNDGRVISINELKYLKIFLWALCYLFFMTLNYILMALSKNFMSFDLASGIFQLIGDTMLFGIWPVIVVSLIITLIVFLDDKKRRKAMLRGFNIR